MGAKSQIEWTEATWEPITGCSKCSSGCDNCYAIMLAAGRLRHHRHYKGLTQITNGRPNWTGELRFNEDLLAQPLRWRQAKRIFVCSCGDLFHPQVPDAWIDRIFAVMALATRHTFQVLTKRPERAMAFITPQRREAVERRMWDHQPKRGPEICWPLIPEHWPLPNVWLGTSVENQAAADKRIPELLATPAAVRWVSIEPLLGPVDLSQWLKHWHIPVPPAPDGDCPPRSVPAIRWVVVGGESGKAARPMHPAWARGLRDQCAAAGVPFFFKQWGEWAPQSQSGWTRIGGRRYRSIFLSQDGGQHDFNDLMDGGRELMLRAGKRDAGALLDGVEHREFPIDSSGHRAIEKAGQ